MVIRASRDRFHGRKTLVLVTHGNDLNAFLVTYPLFQDPYPSSLSHLCSHHNTSSFLSGSPSGLSVEACKFRGAGDSDSTLSGVPQRKEVTLRRPRTMGGGS